MLIKVASHGETTGYEVPCLIVAAKDDLEPHMDALQDSTRVSFIFLLLNSLLARCCKVYTGSSLQTPSYIITQRNTQNVFLLHIFVDNWVSFDEFLF